MGSFQLSDGGPVLEYNDSEITIVGSEKKGFFGGEWKVKYKLPSNPNVTQTFGVSKNTSGVTIGSIRIKVHK